MSNQDQPLGEFNSFDQFFEKAERRPQYWEELAKLEFTREAIAQMDAQDISKGELASRLEVRPGMVTRLLSGRNNFELSTMVRMAMALNCRFKSHLQPIGCKSLWFDVYNGQKNETFETWDPNRFQKVQADEPTCGNLNYVPLADNFR